MTNNIAPFQKLFNQVMPPKNYKKVGTKTMTTAPKKLTKKQLQEIQIMELKAELKKMIDKQGTTLFTETLHTSKSGMLRSIKVYLSDMTDITDMVATIDNYTHHKTGGLRVTGCGMDMGFSVVYNLSVKLYCENGYDHDSAYKLNQRWL